METHEIQTNTGKDVVLRKKAPASPPVKKTAENPPPFKISLLSFFASPPKMNVAKKSATSPAAAVGDASKSPKSPKSPRASGKKRIRKRQVVKKKSKTPQSKPGDLKFDKDLGPTGKSSSPPASPTSQATSLSQPASPTSLPNYLPSPTSSPPASPSAVPSSPTSLPTPLPIPHTLSSPTSISVTSPSFLSSPPNIPGPVLTRRPEGPVENSSKLAQEEEPVSDQVLQQKTMSVTPSPPVSISITQPSVLSTPPNVPGSVLTRRPEEAMENNSRSVQEKLASNEVLQQKENANASSSPAFLSPPPTVPGPILTRRPDELVENSDRSVQEKPTSSRVLQQKNKSVPPSPPASISVISPSHLSPPPIAPGPILTRRPDESVENTDRSMQEEPTSNQVHQQKKKSVTSSKSPQSNSKQKTSASDISKKRLSGSAQKRQVKRHPVARKRHTTSTSVLSKGSTPSAKKPPSSKKARPVSEGGVAGRRFSIDKFLPSNKESKEKDQTIVHSVSNMGFKENEESSSELVEVSKEVSEIVASDLVQSVLTDVIEGIAFFFLLYI